MTRMAGKHLECMQVSENIFAYVQTVILRNMVTTVFGALNKEEFETAVEVIKQAEVPSQQHDL